MSDNNAIFKVAFGAQRISSFSSKLAAHGFYRDNSMKRDTEQRQAARKPKKSKRIPLLHDDFGQQVNEIVKIQREISLAQQLVEENLAKLAAACAIYRWYCTRKSLITAKKMMAEFFLSRFVATRWRFFVYFHHRQRAIRCLIRAWWNYKFRKSYALMRGKISKIREVQRKARFFIARRKARVVRVRAAVAQALVHHVLLFGSSRASRALTTALFSYKFGLTFKAFCKLAHLFVVRRRRKLLSGPNAKVAFHMLVARCSDGEDVDGAPINSMVEYVRRRLKLHSLNQLQNLNSATSSVGSGRHSSARFSRNGIRVRTSSPKTTAEEITTDSMTRIPKPPPITQFSRTNPLSSSGKSSPLNRKDRSANHEKDPAQFISLIGWDWVVGQLLNKDPYFCFFDMIDCALELLRAAIKNPSLLDGEIPEVILSRLAAATPKKKSRRVYRARASVLISNTQGLQFQQNVSVQQQPDQEKLQEQVRLAVRRVSTVQHPPTPMTGELSAKHFFFSRSSDTTVEVIPSANNNKVEILDQMLHKSPAILRRPSTQPVSLLSTRSKDVSSRSSFVNESSRNTLPPKTLPNIPEIDKNGGASGNFSTKKAFLDSAPSKISRAERNGSFGAVSNPIQRKETRNMARGAPLLVPKPVRPNSHSAGKCAGVKRKLVPLKSTQYPEQLSPIPIAMSPNNPISPSRPLNSSPPLSASRRPSLAIQISDSEDGCLDAVCSPATFGHDYYNNCRMESCDVVAVDKASNVTVLIEKSRKSDDSGSSEDYDFDDFEDDCLSDREASNEKFSSTLLESVNRKESTKMATLLVSEIVKGVIQETKEEIQSMNAAFAESIVSGCNVSCLRTFA